MRANCPFWKTSLAKTPIFSGVFELALWLLYSGRSTENTFMARKLYIFNPTGRVKTDASHPGKWVGGFTSSYAYLGDYHARMLGIGGHPSVKRLPSWLHTVAANTKALKGGASRYDPSFRGWG